MKRFYSTLGIDSAIKEQERDNIKANQKVNNMLNSTKTWQERFDEMSEIEEFWGLPYDHLVDKVVKQFISDLITQTREETIIWTLNNIKAFENEWKEYKGSKTKGEYLIQRYKELNKLKK